MTNEIADSWQNELTGLSTYAKDNRERASVSPVYRLDAEDLANLYNGDWLAKRIIEKPILTALAKGWSIDDTTLELKAEYDRLDLQKKVRELFFWSRLFGGAILVIGVENGGDDLAKPLGPNAKGVRYIQAIPRTWVTIVEYEHGEPSLFRITPRNGESSYELHISRCCFLEGGTITPDERVKQQGWGLSVLTPLIRTMRDYMGSYEGTFSLVHTFSQTIYRMTGLAEALANKRGSVIKDRLQQMDTAKGIIGALVIDADGGEDFSRPSVSVAGLDTLLTKLDNFISATIDMPSTELFGTAPSGMNSSGEGEKSKWHATIEEQQAAIGKVLQKVIGLIVGKPVVVTFPPLKQQSEGDKADLHQKQAAADAINIQNGIVTAQEIRQARFGGEDYSIETKLDNKIDQVDLLALAESLKEDTNDPADNATDENVDPDLGDETM